MFKVIKQIEFCYGHRLLDYEGKCGHPHGHNGIAEIEFEAEELDERGMVVDFVDVKELVKEFIDEALDHQMLLRHDDPLVKIFKDLGEPVFVMQENPTAENIAREIFDYISESDLPVVAVRLWETSTSFVEYRPS